MDSFKETQRQIRLAITAFAIILPIGVIGFVIFERFSLLDSIWLTVITLATIGYGDIVARTPEGRVFTIFLILFGLGAVAYGLQAMAAFFLSPAVRDLRQRRRNQWDIDHLDHHFIICGAGELVDEAISTLIESETLRRKTQRSYIDLFQSHETLLDLVVVVTPDPKFAAHLRENTVRVIEGDPTNDDVLIHAGITHAAGVMVMLDNDTESLLTVLTARSINANIDITAAALDENLAQKMVRVGANSVIAHYDAAARFLNNATLRPTVNEFFYSLLLTHNATSTIMSLDLEQDSPWIGQSLAALNLVERFEASIIGLRQNDGTYGYAPEPTTVLAENEVLIVVVPIRNRDVVRMAARPERTARPRHTNWQRLPMVAKPHHPPAHIYSLEDTETAVSQMSQHFIICGSGRVARSAIKQLDPARPFVIISDDAAYTAELVELGFKVIDGLPSQEAVLLKAGVDRALAIMITVEDDAIRVLTVLNSRSLSKRVLITTIAESDAMIPKLRRAGADRVVTPIHIAAQFILLAATRPAISDFFQYVVYNYQAGLETTELYMQDDSPWIGLTIAALDLKKKFGAGVIGLRKENGRYDYAPDASQVLARHDVLIVVTPMRHADELRTLAHGSITRRPLTLRRGYGLEQS